MISYGHKADFMLLLLRIFWAADSDCKRQDAYTLVCISLNQVKSLSLAYKEFRGNSWIIKNNINLTTKAQQ